MSCLLFYFETHPMSFIADQRKILFRKKAIISDNRIVRTANINTPYINMLLSNYLITSINMKVGKIKNLMWRQLVDSAYNHTLKGT